MDLRLKFASGKQKELLLELKGVLRFTQEELATRIGVSRRCLRNWINETRTLPKSVFDKAVSWCPNIERFTADIRGTLHPHWGDKKGGKSRYKQLLETGMFATHHGLMLARRCEISKMKRVDLPKMSIFYRKIESKGIPSLPLLATLLLTDGYLQTRGVVGYTSRDPTLMNIFIDLVRANSKRPPNLLQRDDGRLEAYVFDPDLSKKLLALSPTYKKSPGNVSKKEYLGGPKPVVDFLLAENFQTRVYAVRLAMSADGCITVSKSTNGRFSGSINLGCANPTLLYGWKRVFDSLGIEMGVIKAKVKWAGVGGLIASKKEMLYRFWGLGGFVDGVKITRKSPNFAGVGKNTLLNLFLKARHIID
ncbi:MAG: hypothetical protein QMD00_01080 [Hadesarchaea archaeon]|nr:hypothetical protein [Hadesarchaea archaeon]